MILLLLWQLPNFVYATTYYVSNDGNDTNSGTITAPFKTIQYAADNVQPGDSVIIRDGVYQSYSKAVHSNGVMVFLTKSGNSENWITFKAEHSGQVSLDGQNNKVGYCWYFGKNVAYIRIEGFDISGFKWHGFFSNFDEGTDHIQIVSNVIHHIGNWQRPCPNNEYVPYGLTGIFCSYGNTNWVIEKNIFHSIGRIPSGCNEFDYNHDHGIYLLGTRHMRIINNVFYNNAAGWGIAIHKDNEDIQIVNNTFYGLNPQRAGHILIRESTNVLIQNNISAGSYDYMINPIDDMAWNTNCIVRNNLTDLGKLIQHGYEHFFISSNNLLSMDPAFIDPDRGDFRLSSKSPAIDQGISNEWTPTIDFTDNPRPVGNGIDIGAYEFVNETIMVVNSTAVPQKGDAPLEVKFYCQVAGGTAPYTFHWDFGDGTSSDQKEPVHTFDVGTYLCHLRVDDSNNHIVEKAITIEATSTSANPMIRDAIITKIGGNEEINSVVTEKWFELAIYLDDPQGWEDIAFADVWLSKLEYVGATLSNRGGIFLPDSCYVMSYSIATNSIWARQTAHSLEWTNIKGQLGVFVDDDSSEYRQYPEQGKALAKLKLLASAEHGRWLINVVVKDQARHRSSLFQKPFDVESQIVVNQPQATIILSDPSPTKAGNVIVTLIATIDLVQQPSELIFVDAKGNHHQISLEGTVPGTDFTGTFVINEAVADGTGQFQLPANSLVAENGTTGNQIISGRQVVIDKTAPSSPRNLNIIEIIEND